ncbi:MAG: hypothetical protein EOO43_09465 [Flavobacterium sp.]|nr:MAG: hypothetical protein EOO43_09465 [Flavobacterium sp.]
MTNNAGKTKLHNAFRFIIDDRIVLKVVHNDGKEVYENNPIDNKNAVEVLNQSAFLSAKNDELLYFGVRITFTKIQRDDIRKLVLTKEIRCRKDVNKLQFLDVIKKVEQIDSRTQRERTVSDDFDSLADEIIRSNYRNFFLIEGEQMGLLTPLKGSNLKKTIHSIVSINELDKLVDTSRDFEKEVNKRKREFEGKLINLSAEEKARARKINDLEDELKTLEEVTLTALKSDAEKENKIIEKYKANYNNAKRNRDLAEKLDIIKRKAEKNESLMDAATYRFMTDYMTLPVFSISRTSNDGKTVASLDEHISKYRDFYSARKAELDTSLSEDEQTMMLALEKSQPKPEILQQMVDVKRCFICTTHLGTPEIKYINEKLIPFFKNEFEPDEELDKIDEINDVLKAISISTKKFADFDDEYFINRNSDVVELIQERRKIDNEKEKFIDENGDVSGNEEDEITLVSYDRALIELSKVNRKIENFEEEIISKNRLLSELKVIPIQEDKKTPELIIAEDLHEFSEKLYNVLKNSRKEEYFSFAEKLSDAATIRFRNLMKNNKTANNQEIVVNVLTRNDVDFEFEIKLINSLGHDQSQAGGASQALRQLAIVFGLIDFADVKIRFPFIADAPISKLTPETKRAFFENLLEDKAFNQCIIINMDLWDDKTDSINNLGLEILDVIKTKDASSFITLNPKENNTGVTIKYL